MPSLQSARAFVAVAQHGSFGEAARLLNVTQPTVSAAVARLEADAGFALFHRERTGASLTAHGRRLLDAAVQFVASAEEFEALFTGQVPRGLTLGFMGEAASSVTGRLINIAQTRLGGRIRLRRFDFDDPTCGLASGETDLAIVWPPLSADGLNQLVVSTDRRAVAFPVYDPLAKRDEIGPDELAGRDWVVPRSSDRVWTEFRHPGSVGVPDTARLVESGSVEETLELVAVGAGSALLSESTDQHYARIGVVIVPLTGDRRCTAALAWRRSSRHPTVAEIVADVASLDLPLR